MVLLRLVNLALQRVPKMVRDDRGATALTIFGQILPLLAQERLRFAVLLASAKHYYPFRPSSALYKIPMVTASCYSAHAWTSGAGLSMVLCWTP